MSSSSMLPQSSDVPTIVNGASTSGPDVFSLIVLVNNLDGQRTSARCGNLDLPHVETATVREALSELVKSAKSLIIERSATKQPIPWIDPPHEPVESESRFMVPLHT